MRKVSVSEEEVQRACIELLEAHKYIVLQTVHRKKRSVYCHSCKASTKTVVNCDTCGKPLSQGYGATKGVPDLIVAHPDYPPAVFVGVEVKGTETKVSPEQKALAEQHRIIIVRSADDLARQLSNVEVLMQGDTLPMARKGGKL